MIFRQADNTDPHSWASRLRGRRVELLMDLVSRFPSPVRVLDVGGTVGFWEGVGAERLRKIELTLLNLAHVETADIPNATSVAGDARDLSTFPDRTFHVCFSNSVIEHVGTLFDQISMAREVARVSNAYFVQTPNRYFPLEAHFHVPFWPFLPLSVRTWLHRRSSLGWIEKQRDPILARADVEQIRLLTRREMAHLFPDARILGEHVLGMTKSWFAIREHLE